MLICDAYKYESGHQDAILKKFNSGDAVSTIWVGGDFTDFDVENLRGSKVDIWELSDHKNPGSSILIVMIVNNLSENIKGTRIFIPDQYLQFLMNSIMDNEKNQLDSLQEEIEQIRSLDTNEETTKKIKILTQLLNTRPKLPKQVHVLNAVTTQGSDIIQSAVLQNCMQQIQDIMWEHEVELNNMKDKLFQLEESEAILSTWHSLQEYFFENSSKPNLKLFDNLMSFLHNTGHIIDLHQCGWNQQDVNNHYICVNPIVFIRILCRFHIGEESQVFRLTSSHFWPNKQNKPSVESMVQVLETAQDRGIIPETLFPVLWQEFRMTFNESEVKLLLQAFVSLGMLHPLHPSIYGSSVTPLSLPTYPGLSPNKYYYATVIDCFNDLRPQLNWTPKPYPGDLQISCWFRFILNPPDGLMQRLLCCCHQAVHKDASYQHLWKHGILVRTGEVMLCIEYTSGNITRFQVTGRINSDFHGSEDTAIRMTWLKMAPLILSAISMIHSFQGLIYSTYLVPLGKYFYEPIEIATDSSHHHVFSTGSCLRAWTHKKPLIIEHIDKERILKVNHLFPFEVQKPVSSITAMMELILSMKEEICSESEDSSLITENYSAAKYSVQVSVPKTKKKTSHQIIWKLDEESKESPETSNNNIEGDNRAHSSKEMTPEMEESRIEEENTTNSRIMSEKNENSIAVRIASSFVASIMVVALAQHFVEESSIPVGNIAKITATAATAVQAGDIDAAVSAVFDVVHKVNDMLEVKFNTNRKVASPKSKFCILM
ncbi:hypothetical protein Ahia01_000211400 [Argonauta hians]